MNRIPILFGGLFLTFLTAWLGLVISPFIQFGKLQPYTNEEGQILPAPFSGLAQQGERVYVANGCVYCHSQQVRPAQTGSDIARGWGTRQTVARDYINQKTISLGTMRTGPDLANAGVRLRDKDWHHKHLYNPQITSPGSTMPPFAYLYEKRRILDGKASPNALKLEGDYAPPAGYEIVPTPEAEALVEYLLALKMNYALPEAPVE